MFEGEGEKGWEITMEEEAKVESEHRSLPTVLRLVAEISRLGGNPLLLELVQKLSLVYKEHN